MAVHGVIYFLSFISFISCGYPPTGDEVQAGSVLLPASRRGRYLANIVRRQAVDGTGIRFNKDADRMNAEAKKKVDVLSEELLPYIIAEQERRTTLHKRVMTAIQNGEKGVTVAEIRNKPPLIIRKGLMYRCPSNRAPKEPDGSGILACEDDITPTQVMYDSCLSAEDKELYNADNKYFFCNRHKIEGPDLPRNGTTVIGCAPIERTSLNYTVTKCTLEDTDDIVVHYRYYPDRTYKYVTELDQDHEVCDHWNPCQIGYIYSLPSPDMATPASELWQDSQDEHVHPASKEYISSPRIVKFPGASKGTRRNSLSDFLGIRIRTGEGSIRRVNEKHFSVRLSLDTLAISIVMTFMPFRPIYFGTFYATVRNPVTMREVHVKFLNIVQSSILVTPRSLDCIHGQKLNSTTIPYKCNRCHLNGIMVRGKDQTVSNVDTTRFRQNNRQQAIDLDIENPKPQDFGDYFAIFVNGDGQEERVKILTVNYVVIKIPRFDVAYDVGDHCDHTTTYQCAACELTDVLCNGESVLAAGRVSVVPVSKMVSFNFPRVEDVHSCVYMGFFKIKEKTYKKVLAIVETVKISNMPRIQPPPEGEQFEMEISFICEDCNVVMVFVNGMQLESASRRSNGGPIAFYTSTSSTITIRITEFREMYIGMYQAKFMLGEDTVTKNIMEIIDPNGDPPATEADTTEITIIHNTTHAGSTEPEAGTTGDATGTGGAETTAGGEATTAAGTTGVDATTKAA